MTEPEDVQLARETTAERLERMAREKRDRLDKRFHESKGWSWYKELKPSIRFFVGSLIIFAVVIALILIVKAAT